MSELPVACTLSSDALAARRQGLLAELLRVAQSHEETKEGHRLSFAPTDETLGLIVKAVSAERHCCEFLRFQITVEPAGRPVVLDLTGPPGTARNSSKPTAVLRPSSGAHDQPSIVHPRRVSVSATDPTASVGRLSGFSPFTNSRSRPN